VARNQSVAKVQRKKFLEVARRAEGDRSGRSPELNSKNIVSVKASEDPGVPRLHKSATL
jgi:hypothetical protein